MNFEFSDEQELLRLSVRRFLAERAPVDVHARALFDDRRGHDPVVWAGLADLGVLALLDGPDSADMVSAGVVLEELGRGLVVEPYIGSAVGAMVALQRAHGASARVREGIGDGSIVAALAIHERGRRYEWERPSTHAVDGGDGWRLTGEKVSVLGGSAADSFVVTAEDRGELGLFLVARADLADADVRTEESVDGTRKLAALTLDGTRAERVELDDPPAEVGRAVDHVMVGLATDAVGAAAAALDLAVAYAKERKQFGVAIGSFQAVQHLCADMLRALEIARAGTYYALWACRSAAADERRRAATMAKAYASEALPSVGEGAIQVLGGIGFTWESDAHLFYKRLLSAASLYGNADHHYRNVADLVMG